MGKKFYVVFEGRQPGIYTEWEDALEQVDHYPNPKFKGYSNQREATEAFRKYVEETDGVSLGEILTIGSGAENESPSYADFPEIDLNGWAVDASCLGNPGVMEYRGVELATGNELFKVGPFQDATNNIGEFLAIVHALALQYKTGVRHTIYSDSLTGMSWVRNRRVKTTLQITERNRKVFELVARGLDWLRTHQWNVPVLKWQTEVWGEIPADFNRK